MYAINYHSDTHLILALGIVRKPIVWLFITSQYPGIHDIGLPTTNTPVPKHKRIGYSSPHKIADLRRLRYGAFLNEYE